MPITLDTGASDFAARFQAFLGSKREASEDVDAAAREILRGVETRGDDALIEYSRKFDRVDLTPMTLRIPAEELDTAFKGVDGRTLDALQFAKDRIEAHHRKQVPQDQRYTDPLGVELGYRWTALESVGIYVPGGKAAYPSSVLMNAVPAVVAGVPRIAMCVPAPGGAINRSCWSRRSSRVFPKSIGLAARRRSRHLPTARRRLRRLLKSSAPETPMSPPPSVSCSAESASTWWQGRPKCL